MIYATGREEITESGEKWEVGSGKWEVRALREKRELSSCCGRWKVEVPGFLVVYPAGFGLIVFSDPSNVGVSRSASFTD